MAIPARLEAARTLSKRAMFMWHPETMFGPRIERHERYAIAMPRAGSRMRGFSVTFGMSAARGPLTRALRRPARRGPSAPVGALAGLRRASLQARLQGRHQVDDVSSGRRARLGDGDLLALHLALDRLLDPRLDLIRIGGRIEGLRALLLDELAGEFQLRIADLGALDTERRHGLHLRCEVQLVQREGVVDRAENHHVVA